MYLSKLMLNLLDRSVQRDLRNCHELHRTLMKAFPQATCNPRQTWGVLYRTEIQPEGVVIVQSKIEPNWGNINTGYFLHPPLVKRIDQQYEQIKNGMVLRFRLQANPTRKIAVKTENGFKKNGQRVPLFGDDDRIEWLRRHGERGGFRLREESKGRYAVNMVSRTVLGYRKNPHTNDNALIRFDGVVFDGQLIVVDADQFKRTLAEGLGPGKAYGFGLLSVARCI